jgi:K+-sensing histidine kinase KdpD
MWRLVKLVNMIMDYERFENKDLDLEFEEKIINNTIHWVVEQYKNNLIISSQQIDFDEKKTLLRYDEEKIVQIVHNVISNFLKYAWKWTTLSIKIRENFIEFADNWWWVNEKNIPYLTEKFYQEDESKTWSANERGIWVGLSIVDKVVKWHKWKMKIDNNNGNGFRILIFTKSSH